MTKFITLTFGLLLFTLNSFATLPDSIRIVDKSFRYLDSYSYEYVLLKKGNHYIAYQVYSLITEKGKTTVSLERKRLTDISGSDVENVVIALNDSSYKTLSITNFGFSKESLTNNQNSLWSYVRDRYSHWTEIQRQFVMSELLKIDNYNKALRRTVLGEGYIPLSRHSGSNFTLTLYYSGEPVVVTASENLFGFPWQTQAYDIFNTHVPETVSKIIPENKSFNKERFNRATNNIGVLKMLVRQIYDDECSSKVGKLAPLAFASEISELEPYFKIIDSKEYPYYGRYIKSDSQTFRITLKNDLMKQGVSMQYFISRNGNTLYTRDSLLKKYKSVITRVQNIQFLMDFIHADTSRKIEICFFDDRAFNDYNIDDFNKNPTEWSKYEEMVKLIPSQKQFLNLYCGCNFRLEKEYLKNAIFFELISEFKEKSIWVLLPDETPVLWFFEGSNAYKYSYKDYKTKGVSVQYACQKFDSQGHFKK